ncbi:MAG: hypothetical protein AAGC79_05030 [Pseudomonadota bacterium]
MVDRNIALTRGTDYSNAFFARKHRLDQVQRLGGLRRSQIQCLGGVAALSMRRRRLRA